ncbi:MAG: ABC transporter ATP-binding protein [Candidatus Bathyarchaeia archaeon]
MGWHHHMIIDEEETKRKIPDRVLLIRLLRYLGRAKLKTALLLVVVVAGIGTSLATPYISQIAIDSYLLNTSLPVDERLVGLTFVITLFLLVYLANFPIESGRTYLSTMIGRKVEYDLRMDLFSRLQALSLSYFDKREVGRIMSRITNDVDNLTELITSGVVSAFADILTLAGIVSIMLLLNLELSLMAFLMVPFMGLFVWVFGKRAREAYRRTRRTISGVTSQIEESVSGMREIQAYSKETQSMRAFDRTNVENLEANVSAARIQSLFFPAIGAFGAGGLAVILWYGGSTYIANPLAMPWGVLYAFMQYLTRFFFPIQDLSMFYNNIQSAMAGAERIVDVLDTEVEVKEPERAIELPPIEGEIKLENVTFGYEPETPVLQNIDLHIKAKENIAVVGPTGAGKTTLINLVYRFYDPQEGRITADGHALSDVSLKSLRSQMAIVLQDPFLFSGSVKENIRYGKPDVSDEQVMEAAKAVGAHDFIMAMPEGYETDVRERGGRLSMGQRQLVSFARALLVNPRILIMDEATSSVDAYTELLIQRALKKILKGRTSIVIAHRLSTVRNADRIIVLDQGRIVEEGNHQQLMKQGGLYRRLYDMQFR